MRAAAILLLVGCNQIYSLDPTTIAPTEASIDADTHLDEDLDGIFNDVDNCPGVANADQADTSDVLKGLTADGVGDACDPNDSDRHAVLAMYFFNDHADDMTFSASPASGIIFHQSHVDISVTGETVFSAVSAAAYARGELTVEAGFEIIDHQAVAKIGVFTDGDGTFATTHRAYIDFKPNETDLVTSEPPNQDPCVPSMMNATCSVTAIPQLPPRVVLQLRAGAANEKKDGLKGILAATGVDNHSDSSGSVTNRFGVFVKDAHVRLLHIVLYRRL